MHKKTVVTRTALPLAITAVIAVSGALLYSTYWREASATAATDAPPAPHAVKVALAHVQRSNLPQVYSGVGELEASRQVQVAAEVAGRVTRIAFESGQSVQAGQLLVQLNDAPEQALALQHQAQLRNAQTLLARARKLRAENAATQEQLEGAMAARDMAAAELRHTEAVIAQKAIRAPFAGQIGIRLVHVGQYLQVATPVSNLIDARTLYANFSLDEQTAPHLAIGQSVRLRLDAQPGRDYAATISAIDPLIARARTVQVQAVLVDPTLTLKPGMYASVDVTRPNAAESLTVPETAVTYTAYGETVFVARAAAHTAALTVERIAVKVGIRREGRVEILQGLKADERVVTSGQLKLSDGMPVQPVEHDTLNQTPHTTPAAGA